MRRFYFLRLTVVASERQHFPYGRSVAVAPISTSVAIAAKAQRTPLSTLSGRSARLVLRPVCSGHSVRSPGSQGADKAEGVVQTSGCLYTGGVLYVDWLGMGVLMSTGNESDSGGLSELLPSGRCCENEMEFNRHSVSFFIASLSFALASLHMHSIKKSYFRKSPQTVSLIPCPVICRLPFTGTWPVF